MNKKLYKQIEKALKNSDFEICINTHSILIQDKEKSNKKKQFLGTYLIFDKNEFKIIEFKKQLLKEKEDYKIESLMNETSSKYSYKISVKLNEDFTKLFNLLFPIVDRKEKIKNILDE